MVDIKAAAQHLGIDYADDPMVSANLQRAFMAAQYRLYGSVGYDVEDLMPDDPRVDQARAYLHRGRATITIQEAKKLMRRETISENYWRLS